MNSTHIQTYGNWWKMTVSNELITALLSHVVEIILLLHRQIEEILKVKWSRSNGNRFHLLLSDLHGKIQNSIPVGYYTGRKLVLELQLTLIQIGEIIITSQNAALRIDSDLHSEQHTISIPSFRHDRRQRFPYCGITLHFYIWWIYPLQRRTSIQTFHYRC